MFVGQSQQMRKCDFGHHSVSILFVRHEIYPRRASKRSMNASYLYCTLSHLLVLILCFCDPEAANLVLQGSTLQS
jgi:hypothetical protein